MNTKSIWSNLVKSSSLWVQ